MHYKVHATQQRTTTMSSQTLVRNFELQRWPREFGIMHHDDDGSWTIAYQKKNHEHDQKNYDNRLLVGLKPTRQMWNGNAL